MGADHADTPILARRRVRVGLVAAVGVYLFVLCAAYLARAPVVPVRSYAVLGPTVVEPGGTFPVRVVAYGHKPRGQKECTIVAATIDDGLTKREIALADVSSGVPAVAHIGPAPKREGPFTLVLTVESEGERREVVAPLVVYYPKLVADPPLLGLQDPIPEGPQLLLEILPESDGLALGVDNRIWVRVTDRAGRPAAGAEISWTVTGADPAQGATVASVAGLAALTVKPRSLAPRFEVRAQRPGADGQVAGGTLEETHHAMGAGAMVRVDRLVRAQGEPPHVVSVLRADSDKPVWCDLYRGDAWTRTWRLAGDAESDAASFEVDVASPDNYRVQCYSHFAEPGDGADAVWLFRRDVPRIKAVGDLLRGGVASTGTGCTSQWRRSVPIVDEPATEAILSAYRTRQVDVSPPALVAGTRKADIEAAAAANRLIRVRFFVMIGLSFGLIILWALFTAVQTAIENRTRLQREIADLPGDLVVEIKPPTNLVRTRAAVSVALVLVVLVLNVLAMLELFKYM